MLSSVSDLLTYIDEQQLTPEFGGTLEYCHSEWVIFRTVRTGYLGVGGQLRKVFCKAAGNRELEETPEANCIPLIRCAKESSGVRHLMGL